MRSRVRPTLFLIVFIAVAWFVLSRVQLVLFVPTSPLALLAFIAITAVVIFLAVDHLLNRAR
ncbi:MAG TPA: hypothetical protein VJG32_13160 [Anaerolineae bacterium]|nr:hypothetical protein [Anaerolineae bacterium]